MFETALFDLDGTLTESGTGITRSAAYALRAFGIDERDRQKLNRFVGPPLIGSFQKFYGLSDEQSLEAVRLFREYYAETGIFENRVYDGVVEMLEALKLWKVRLVVATSKPEAFAVRILEHYGLMDYFSVVAGATMDHTRTKKDEVIAYALEKGHITDRSSVVMVGDREHDVLGAKAHGLPTIGVLYGYGSREELLNAGAMALAETPQAVVPLMIM